jgi:hypothetical protein
VHGVQARATDSSLSQLINAGRDEISSGQTATLSLLQEIIGKQEAATAAAQQAAASLAAIQSLASQQSATEQSIAASTRQQLNSIQVSIISFFSFFLSCSRLHFCAATGLCHWLRFA